MHIINLHKEMAKGYDSPWTTWKWLTVCVLDTLAARHKERSGSSTQKTPRVIKTTLHRAARRTLTQLRTNKCPLLLSYLNKIDEDKHPSPQYPICKSEPHTTIHLFNCTNINTQLKFTAPVGLGNLLVEWRGPPISQWAWIPAIWGISSAGVPRSECRCARQQQLLFKNH